MISLKGLVQVVKTDSVTGEVTTYPVEENLIPNSVFRGIPISTGTNYGESVQIYQGSSIVISTDTATPSKHKDIINGVIGVGFVDNGVTSPTIVDAGPTYFQVQQRIGFVGVSRTISTIGLTKVLSATVISQVNSYSPVKNSVPVVAYLKLSVPCVQGPTDILDIFYRIVLDTSNFSGQYKMTARGAKDITEQMIGSRGYNPGAATGVYAGTVSFGTLFSTPCTIPDQTNYPYLEFGTANDTTSVSRYAGFIGGYGGGTDNSLISSPDYYSPSANRVGTASSKSYSSFRSDYIAAIPAYTTLIGQEAEGPGTDNNKRMGCIFNGLVYGKSNNTPALNSYSSTGVSQPINIPAAYYADNIFSRSIFQSVFTHSINALYPFQDVNNLGYGGGTYTLTETPAWTSKIPKLLRVKINATGAVGTSNYNFAIRNYLGFSGNSWTYERPAICPFVMCSSPYVWETRGTPPSSTYPVPFTNCHGNNSSNATKFSSTQIVQWDNTGLTLLDVMTGAYQNFDVVTTPALAVTDLRQVEVDKASGLIYAACRNTGLYRITPGVSPTVVNLSTDPCTGVDVGRAGVVYCTFSGVNGRLSASPNYSTPLTFSSVDITSGTGASWSNVVYIKADPEHVNDRLAIVSVNTSSALQQRIIWYQASDNSAVSLQHPTNGQLAFTIGHTNMFDVGDLLSLWVIQIQDQSIFLTWGATTYTPTTINYGRPPGNSIQFTEQGYFIGDSWVSTGSTASPNVNLTTGPSIVCNIATPAGSTYAYTQRLSVLFSNKQSWNEAPNLGASRVHSERFVYLSKGLGHFGQHNCIIFPNFIYSSPGGGIGIGTGGGIRNPLIWDEYIWSGSAWVLAPYTFSAGTWTPSITTGSKTTHSGAQALIDGLSINFTNGAAPATSFVVDDYYTQIICNGLHHDHSNTFTTSWSLYLKPLIRNQAISGTIPSSPPYQLHVNKGPFGASADAEFSVLENSSVSPLVSLNIAGYANPVVTYYSNPLNVIIGPNEVAIDPKGNIMFSPSDTNKAVTGTYAYIQSGEAYPAISALFGVKGLAFGFDNTSITNTGGFVSSWGDITGNDFNATQAASGNRPTYIASGLNSLPVVSFNDAAYNRYMQIAGSNSVANGKMIEDLSLGFTYIAVVNSNAVPSGGSYQFGHLTLSEFNNPSPADANFYNRGLRFGVDSSNAATFAFNDTTLNANTLTGSSYSASLWSCVIITVYPDRTGQIRTNQVITNLSATQTGIFDSLAMEPRNSNYINYAPYFNTLTINSNTISRCSLAALYFFNVGLNKYECEAIEAALKAKYALTGY